jgi:hypothetical protein
MTSPAIEGACAFAWRNYLLSTAISEKTITGVPRSIVTSLIFAIPVNMTSISCK